MRTTTPGRQALTFIVLLVLFPPAGILYAIFRPRIIQAPPAASSRQPRRVDMIARMAPLSPGAQLQADLLKVVAENAKLFIVLGLILLGLVANYWTS